MAWASWLDQVVEKVSQAAKFSSEGDWGWAGVVGSLKTRGVNSTLQRGPSPFAISYPSWEHRLYFLFITAPIPPQAFQTTVE